MTGHGWVWRIDETGDPIGAPVELHDVSLKGVNRDGGYSFDALTITTAAHDPFGAPLELTGHDGPIPEHLRELFASNDVQVGGTEGDVE